MAATSIELQREDAEKPARLELIVTQEVVDAIKELASRTELEKSQVLRNALALLIVAENPKTRHERMGPRISLSGAEPGKRPSKVPTENRRQRCAENTISEQSSDQYCNQVDPCSQLHSAATRCRASLCSAAVSSTAATVSPTTSPIQNPNTAIGACGDHGNHAGARPST